jgi:hypothetical protein
MLVDGDYKLLMCQSEMTLRYQQEVLLKTTANSGINRGKATRLNETFADVSGLTPVASTTDTISWFYVMQESIRTKVQSIRATFRDGNGVGKQIAGSAVIAGGEITGAAEDFASASIQFEFTDGVTFSEVEVPQDLSEQIFSDYWTTAVGATSVSGASTVHSYSLSGKTVLGVWREGTEYDLVSGTPGNRQCRQNGGAIEFGGAYPFEAGETVFVIFKN